VASVAISELPRVLVISFSGIGSPNATGQLLEFFFRYWPDERIFQVYHVHEPIGFEGLDASKCDPKDIVSVVRRFRPDVIYFRPADNHLEYMRIARLLIETLDLPLVVHIMDDWPARMKPSKQAEELHDILKGAFGVACRNVTICAEMSREYEERYGHVFESLANGIDVEDWRLDGGEYSDEFVIRYCGAIAEDMQKESVQDLAEAVQLAVHAHPTLRLEIYTMPWFQEEAKRLASLCSAISVHDFVPLREYPQLLASADALFLGYNFDAQSIRYTRLSFANKTPECLASGTPLIIYGPEVVPSVAYIKRHAVGRVVSERSIEHLAQAIGWMIENPLKRRELGQRARRFAFANHNGSDVRRKFEIILRSCFEKGKREVMRIREFARDDDVVLDETKVVFDYFDGRSDLAMIDVGAHHGTAFKAFLDQGWEVFAFEPDPANRSYVEERYGDNPAIRIEPNAVGDRHGARLDFFASEQSTGISSLIPFHEGHAKVATVETVRLDRYMEEHGIEDVAFLKIDTEGFDLRVLEGFPWEKCQPEVIECEYEDAKTTKIGYTYENLGQFLVDRGYTVFVSEWHPIVRYGVRHQWRRVVPYPATLRDEDAWGNFLAFRDSISIAEVEALFQRTLRQKNPGKVLTRVSQPIQSEQESDAIDSGKQTMVSSDNESQPGRFESFGNHRAIAKDFVSSKRGVICATLLTLGVLFAVFWRDLALLVGVEWAGWVILGVGIGCLVHLVAYVRAGFEHGLVQQRYAIEERLDGMDQRIENLMVQIQKTARVPPPAPELELREKLDSIQSELRQVHHQYVDLKTRLPEIMNLIERLFDTTYKDSSGDE
jgi:FkbM family methyltransferase|tara:strand:- start:277 stop:2775 length:2499 start_codon:yes stop_codon:yes gene_type:complete